MNEVSLRLKIILQEDDETAEAMEDEPEEGSMAVVLHEVILTVIFYSCSEMYLQLQINTDL